MGIYKQKMPKNTWETHILFLTFKTLANIVQYLVKNVAIYYYIKQSLKYFATTYKINESTYNTIDTNKVEELRTST